VLSFLIHYDEVVEVHIIESLFSTKHVAAVETWDLDEAVKM
nr:hypothetical protein [Tanacetum cinerariifolium]